LACSGDEFFEAIRQFAEMNGLPGYYAENFIRFDGLIDEFKYVISVLDHTDIIIGEIKKIVDKVNSERQFTTLHHQFKLYNGAWEESSFLDGNGISSEFTITTNPQFNLFSNDPILGAI